MDEDLITKKVKKERSDKANNFIFDIITIICIVIIAIAVTPKSFQNDTFYNIKCGNYIFEHGVTNIAHDPFSWHNLPYSWPHWLYDLLTYVFYAMCGRFWTTGIYVLTMILTAILGFSIYKTSLKLTNKNRIVSGLASLFALYLLKPYIAARAQLVTFILFVWEIFFIEKLLETNKKRYGLALLFIAFLIVQLHCAVFPMFFVFALPYLAEFVFIVLSDLDLDEVLFKNKVELNNVLNIHTSELIIGAIKRKLGIGYVIKELVAHELDNGYFKEIKLEGLPKTGISLVYIENFLTDSPRIFLKEYYNIEL